MATLRGQASRAPADSSQGARTHPPGSEDAPEAGIPSSARQCPLCPCVQGRGVRWERRDPEGSALSLCRAMGTDLLGAKGSCSSIPPWAQVLVEGGKAALPAFLSQTHLPSGNVPLHCQQGTAEALAGDQPARTRLHLESSRKGHRRAARRHQQPERGRAGTVCPAGLSAPRGRLPPSAASEDVPPFLLAPQPSQRPDWHRGTLPQKVTPLARDPGTPAQREAGERQPFSPLPGPRSGSPGSWR